MSDRFKQFWNSPINGTQIYFLAFVIYFLSAFMQDTTFSDVIGGHWLRLISYICLPLLLFKVYVLDKWSKGQLLGISIIIILGVITWRKAQDMQLLLIVPFLVGARNVDFIDIISWYIYLNVILILIMAVFSLVGIIPNLVYHSVDRPTRYSLGLIYSSNLATHYFYLVMAYCYLKFDKLRWFDYLFIFVGDYLCMLITNTKLDFIATLIVIPIVIIAQRAFRGYKWSKLFADFWWMSVPITSSIIIFASYFYNPSNHIMHKLDSISSGRLALGHEAFAKYNVKMFGQYIIQHSYGGIKGLKLANQLDGVSHYFFIDSSYLRMILIWGFAVFILIIISMTYIAIRSTLNRTYILSGIILVASLNFMFEPDIIKIIYNPFLLALLAEITFENAQGEIKNE